jgi:hypothetical protein
MFVKYSHHGIDVWVNDELKGKHRDHCLCFSCELFHPNESNNCRIAQATFVNCVEFGTVTPMYECSNFKQKV